MSTKSSSGSTSSYNTSSSASSSSATSQKNLCQLAKEFPYFSTFYSALQAADLARVFEGQGPYTIFAPSNEAFAKLPQATWKELLKPENRAKLAAILKYHVVPGKILASAVKTSTPATVNGKEFNIRVQGNSVTVNNARVTKTDIIGSNGVIHVIDTVLIPS